MTEMNLYRYVSVALLAALGLVFQFLHVGYLSPWGMWIDIVAVPVILALFLFDFKHSLAVAILIALVISIGAPSGFIGATMKFLGTLPMFLVLGLGAKWKKMDVSKVQPLVILLIAALTLRAIITIIANYYWALPIWMGVTTTQAFEMIPWWVIAGLNAIQGIVEVSIAWTLAFKFKLVERYGCELPRPEARNVRT